MGKIVSIATGVPKYQHRQDDIFSFADNIYSQDKAESRKLRFLYKYGGIDTRYSVIPDYSGTVEEREFYEKTPNLEPFPNLEKRMDWYKKEAGPLSIQTIQDCIAGKIQVQEITHLITVSCTGMSAPGLDLEIMEKMGLPRNIFRSSVNFMGCYAAMHALRLADALCQSVENANVVVVCTELCTLHFQPEPSIDNITATLLFADGCAAVLMQHDGSVRKGIRLQHFFSDVAFKGKNDMSWQLSSNGFLMTLSGYVPELVLEDFDGLFNKSLANAGMAKQEITHWCIHPGGKKILEAIEKSISLPQESLAQSYEVLRNYGNMSSATILFVLQKIWLELETHPPETRATIFGAAFGPGLTMETFTATYD